MILGYGLQLMTKDVDGVEIHGSSLQDIAIRLFGKDSPGSQQWGFYLETVSSGLPPLPAGYPSRCIDVIGPWSVIRPKRPEAHDLIVTKLQRFHARDREDVQILCDTGGVSGEVLKKRLDSAFEFHADEGEDPGRKKAYASLRLVHSYLKGERRGL